MCIWIVSILIFMESTKEVQRTAQTRNNYLKFQSLFSWNLQKRKVSRPTPFLFNISFNPYFHGIYKRGRYFGVGSKFFNNVSILIFMESTKEEVMFRVFFSEKTQFQSLFSWNLQKRLKQYTPNL